MKRERIRAFSTNVSNEQKLSLEKSVKWAKKHKKNYGCFYQQLGKSIEVNEKEGGGKSNYQLQE